MVLELRCECGFVARGDEASFVAQVQGHALKVHKTQLSVEAIVARATSPEAEHPSSC